MISPPGRSCSVRWSLSPARNWRTPSDASLDASGRKEKQCLFLLRRLRETRLGWSVALGSQCVRSCRDGIRPLSSLWTFSDPRLSMRAAQTDLRLCCSILSWWKCSHRGEKFTKVHPRKQRSDKHLFTFVHFLAGVQSGSRTRAARNRFEMAMQGKRRRRTLAARPLGPVCT